MLHTLDTKSIFSRASAAEMLRVRPQADTFSAGRSREKKRLKPKPKTAHEKSLAPMVVALLLRVKILFYHYFFYEIIPTDIRSGRVDFRQRKLKELFFQVQRI